MATHVIKLHGDAASDDRVSGPVLAELLHLLVDGSRRALRYRVEGRSTAQGTIPGWVKRGAAFNVLKDNSAATITLEAPALVHAIPDRVDQGGFFINVDPQLTALHFLEDALEDAMNGKTDSDLFDSQMVSTLADLGDLFDEGVDTLEWVNGRTVKVERDGVERVRDLKRQTPAPQAVRVVGKLNEMRAHDLMFKLVLEGGKTVQGIASDLGHEKLKAFWGQPAVVTGMAIFKPSGAVLRVDAEDIAAPTAADRIMFSAMPQPLFKPLEKGPGFGRFGILALRGHWPGDESDDEVEAALREIG
jgi:hypothetical protein